MRTVARIYHRPSIVPYMAEAGSTDQVASTAHSCRYCYFNFVRISLPLDVLFSPPGGSSATQLTVSPHSFATLIRTFFMIESVADLGVLRKISTNDYWYWEILP
jgi:hypothetical protein